MYSLSLSSVPQWVPIQNKWCPQSIDTICPFCGRTVTLRLERYLWDEHRNTMTANAICPGCHEKVRFWIIDPGDGRDSSQRGCAYLGIYPKPRINRKPIVEPDNLNSPALARVYQAAFNAYNAGLWDACATTCRKTLEGLVYNLLPEDDRKGALFAQLQKLPEKVNLAEPLITLADSLRKGGNLGAHFDLTKEPDQHVAELMLDLLDYFMEYIYVLKEKAKSLEKKIESLGNNNAGQ
jgi:hypothetical protein